MEKKCRRCGKLKKETRFKTDKRQPDGRTVTCRECYTNNKLEKFVRTPEQIESQRKKITGRKYTFEHRLAISEGNKKAVFERRHPWKKNITEHPDQNRCQLEYKIWKEKVFLLRGRKCKECGRTDRLHVHHIECYYNYPEKRLDPENGEILCISCHMRHHRRDGGIQFKKLKELTP